MLLGAIAGSRRRPSSAAVPLPFALGGYGAVYDPYHLASMVTSGGSAPAGAIGDQIIGIIPSHGTNETPTDGWPAPGRLVLDQAGFDGFLNPLLTVKDGVQCWDMRDATFGRALGGNCLGVDMRASRKGCWGAMLWLEYDVEGSPMCMNRDASPSGNGLIVPWDMYEGRPNYPYGMAKISTSGVVPLFVDPTNTESSFKPAEGVTGGWFACIAQWSISSASNNATVRYNTWMNGVEKQDTTSSAKKVWDANADADNYDRFTLGGQRDAGAKARGWDSWIGRTFWTEDFLDDTAVAAMTAWLQGTAYVAPSFAAPFSPVFRMGAQTGSNVLAPDGGLPWLTTANAASAAPVSAAVTLAGSGDHYQDAGGSAGYGYDPSGNYLRFPKGALAEWELYGDPITVAISGVPNGPARVNLIFREGYFTGPGNRIFDITINGTLRQDNLDLAAVYGAGAVVCLSYDVTVSDGTLTIVLDASVDNACLTGVEVLV